MSGITIGGCHVFEILATAVVVGFVAIALIGHVMVAQALFTNHASD